jgi:hypothetical protein
MLTNIFANRDKKVVNMLKLKDFLGRCLRENLELFSFDGTIASFLTESGMIVQGVYEDKKTPALCNIQVESAELFSDVDKFNAYVEKNIGNMLNSIHSDNLEETDNRFDRLMSLFETKVNFTRTQRKLKEQVGILNSLSEITKSDEFSRLVELKDSLVKLISESNSVGSVPEIINSMRLSNIVSQAFNLPKLSYDNIKNREIYIKEGTLPSIYEILCTQELVRRELIEAKNNLGDLWADNDKVSTLASLAFSRDNDEIIQALAEAIYEVPYLALASKRQLGELMTNSLSLTEDTLTIKDKKSYVAKLFEMKKPVKKEILKVLSEQYGVTPQTVSELPSFFNLAKTQRVLFESLARIAPRNSNVKRVLNEFAEFLKDKAGVEVLDVNEFVADVFKQAGYTELLTETSLLSYMNFDKVAQDLGKIGHILKMIHAGMAQEGGGMMQPGMEEPGMEQPGMEQPGMMEPGMGDPGMDSGMDSKLGPDGVDGINPEDQAMQGVTSANPLDGEEQIGPDGDTFRANDDDDINDPQMSPEDAAADAEQEFQQDLAADGELPPDEEGGVMEPGMEDPNMQPGMEEPGMDEFEGESPMVADEELMAQLDDLEAIMADLKAELYDSDSEIEGEGEFDMEGGEEGQLEPEEDEENGAPLDTEEDEDEFPPKKKPRR